MDFLTLLTNGIILGLSAGFAPGPLSVLVISQTIQYGTGEGVKSAFAPLITDLRRRADEIRTAELERFQAKLAGLDDGQREVVEALTRGIVNTLLHEPTVRLKDAAGRARGDRLAESLRDLFDL